MKRVPSLLVLSLFSCSLALAATNANTFFVAKTSAVGNQPACIAVGDFNGDGKLDIVTGDAGDDAVAVLLGQGNGTFKPARSFLVDSAPQAIIAADFNGDGKLDLAVATGKDVFILLGNGDGTFRTGGAYASSSSPTYMAVGDVNNDGKLDIAISSDNSFETGVILGNGDGTFGSLIQVSNAGIGPVALGDLTGNGKLDLIVANDGGNGNAQGFVVALGNGDGTFNTPKALGAFESSFSPKSIVVGDFNNDGHLDIAVGNNGTSNSAFEQIAVALGDGTGKVGSLRYFTTGGEPASLIAADVNGDGNLDLVVANTYDADVTVLLGNGKGGFSSTGNYVAGDGLNQRYLTVAVGDFNGDGKPDIAVANPGPNSVSVLLGSGAGKFADARDYRAGLSSLYEAAGDFNNDGKQDVIVASYGNGLFFLAGNGNGTFKAPVQITNAVWGPFVAADLNGDGLPDLISINPTSGSEISVLLNTGNGTFAPPVSYFSGNSPATLAVGDFNGDGKLDVAVTIQSFVAILLGNGDGTLQSPMPFDAGSQPEGLAVGDFNGDGKLDIVAASGEPYVIFGKGDGTFGPPQLVGGVAEGVQTLGVGYFHGTGKGKLDIASLIPGQSGSQVCISPNLGNGTFAGANCYPVGPIINASTSMAVADYNLDGNADIAIAAGGSNATVLFGAGNDTFTVTTFGSGGGTPTGQPETFPINILSTDFNGDKKPDLAVADGNDGVTILLNQTK